jgi:putative intracellular protease/amidase
MIPQDTHFQIGSLLFEGLDRVDLTGPFEVLSRIPNSTYRVFGKSIAPVRDVRGLRLTPDAGLADAPRLDVLHIPGGYGQEAFMDDEELLGWVRKQAAGAKLVFSVCTGALICGAAGLLKSRRATTHWASFHLLPYFGAIPVNERVVVDGEMVFATGVAAGMTVRFELLPSCVVTRPPRPSSSTSRPSSSTWCTRRNLPSTAGRRRPHRPPFWNGPRILLERSRRNGRRLRSASLGTSASQSLLLPPREGQSAAGCRSKVDRTTTEVRHPCPHSCALAIRSKGCLSNKTALAMAFKLVEGAQKTWRRLDGQNLLPKLIANVKFKDGIVASLPQAKAAA